MTRTLILLALLGVAPTCLAEPYWIGNAPPALGRDVRSTHSRLDVSAPSEIGKASLNGAVVDDKDAAEDKRTTFAVHKPTEQPRSIRTSRWAK